MGVGGGRRGGVDAHRGGEFCALGGSLDDLDDEDIPVAVASAAFLPAPRAGARLFGGISEERLMRVVFCRSLGSRREMCGCAG